MRQAMMFRCRHLKYKLLVRSDGPEIKCLKCLVMCLVIVCVFFLCYVTYSIAFRGMKGDAGKSDQSGASVVTKLQGEIGKQVQGQDGKSDTDVRETEDHVGYDEGPVLGRAMIQARINTAVAYIKSGKGDAMSWQLILQFLQLKLKQMDEEALDEEKGNEHLQGDVSSEEEGEERRTTLENPRIKDMLKKLTDTPKSLDIYDLTKPLVWDFRCFFMKLGLHPDPAICVDSIQVEKSIPEAGTWENVMLRFYIEILKSDPGLQAIDLGSTVGLYSLTAAALGRPVLAVEPNVLNILPFHKSVVMNYFQEQVTLVTNPLSYTYKLVQLIYDSDDDLGKTKTSDITESRLRNNVIDPNDVIRTVTLNDLYPAMRYKKAVLKIDLEGDDSAVFGAASKFFHLVHIRYVLLHWKYTDNPIGYDFIADFLKQRNYVPNQSPHGKTISDSDMKKNHQFIVWIKF